MEKIFSASAAGKDVGRKLVLCDDCQTWDHLESLGIKDIAKLGREEDPWHFHNCVTLRLPISEPAFAPVEEDLQESSVGTKR
jgi:hypothetical protein